MAEPFWRESEDGLIIVVRLTPRGGRDSIDGVDTMSDGNSVLSARVRVPPEDGAANKALFKLLAKHFGVSASQVTLVKGATSRLKFVNLRGDKPMLIKLASALLGVWLMIFCLASPKPARAEARSLLPQSDAIPLDVCASKMVFYRAKAGVYRGPITERSERQRLLRVIRVSEQLAEEGCPRHNNFFIRRATGGLNVVFQAVKLPLISLPIDVAMHQGLDEDVTGSTH
jgi:uncharacterized protein (TIGR00251 family)